MDFHKPYSVGMPKFVTKVLVTVGVVGALYLGVMWAGSKVTVMPTHEFDGTINTSIEAMADDALKARGQE